MVAALAGCGGPDPATTTSTGEPRPLSKAEFVDEADRICFATKSQIEAAADDLFIGRDEPSPGETRRIALRFVVPRLRSEAETIRLLGAPRGDEAEVEAILAATERGADAIEADPTAYLEEPPAALREAARLARAYGSMQCGLR